MADRKAEGQKPADGRSYLRRIILGLNKKRLSRLEENDIIFREPLTPQPAEPPAIMVRGSIDMWFMLLVLILLSFGAVMCYSASSVYAQQYYGDSTHFLWHYILFATLSIVGTLPFVLFARPWFWRLFGICAYAVSIILLLLVLLVGREGGGAQRWIVIGPLTFQPSEVAKMSVVLAMALFMSKYESKITSDQKFGGSFRYGVIVPFAIFGVVCLLVALERHISGLMIIGMIGLAVMFMGGTRMRYILLIFLAIAAAGAFLILVSDYAQTRVFTWLNLEEADPLGSAWQTWQGLYAIGSGGLFGRGLGNSQQKFGYVAEPQNDFIFTIICEELGFFGAALIVALFALLIRRGFKIAARAPDKFSALAVSGLTFKLALQVIMNIAVVTNSMPNTGVSLPFFSSGGTSLAVQIFEMGIILSVSRYSIQKK
ncbi:MAG: FtsW/RodA/SpoVE family cell cycle protein [Eubacteriales bacterium]|jgi:cell division protein FtsW